MDNQQLAQHILAKIGGKKNINQHWHCITRLRFNLNDKRLANLAELSALDGVMGVHFQGDQLQIILGNKVSKVFKELDKLVGDTHPSTVVHKPKQSMINGIFDFLSGIFTPILPAIVGTGLLKGILSLLVVLNFLSTNDSTYNVLYGISEAAFYFLPILVASSAAKKFKTHEYLAITLACILLYPSLSASLLIDSFTLSDANTLVFPERPSFNLFGLSIPNNIDYHASVIPIILSVWLLSYINRFVEKVIPALFKMILTPIIVLVVTSIIMLIVIAPLGSYLGYYLSEGFKLLFDSAGPIAGLVMGGGMSLLVITGMHYAIFPSTFENFRQLGYDFMLLPISIVSNLAQAGATLAVAIKIKRNKAFKSLAFSSAISAMLGITEPAIYGVTTKLRKPFYCALVAGALGGAVVGFFAVKVYQFSLPGLTALPTYISTEVNDHANLWYIIVAISLSFISAFLMTLCCQLDENLVNSQNESEKNISNKSSSCPTAILTLMAPISGEVAPLAQVPDHTFAEKIMGDGIAILPIENQVLAPCNGYVSVITPTQHAIGIISDEGIELLIHVGIDTVSLKGNGFKCFVEQGQRISVGELLLEFDIALIEHANLTTITPIVITNNDQFKIDHFTQAHHVKAGQDILMNINKSINQ